MNVFLPIFLALFVILSSGCGSDEISRTQTAKTIGELTQQAAVQVDEDCLREGYRLAREQMNQGNIVPNNGCRLASYKVVVKGQEAERFCLPDARNLTFDEYKRNKDTITCPDDCEEGAKILIGNDCRDYDVIFCNQCE